MHQILANFTQENFWFFISNDVWPLIQFLIGISFVVLVHEFGHFTAARLVGIKVERFALGLGPRIFKIQGKETEYCVCAIPLGGYVKMLGQEDFAPQQDGEDRDDPDYNRRYDTKSVGQRMFVIASGVVMNVIFAAVLFVGICMVGMNFSSPLVGRTAEDYPASKLELTWTPELADGAFTGIAPGDRVVSIDGKQIDRFEDIRIISVLASDGEEFRIEVEREIDGTKHTGTGTIKAVRLHGDKAPVFGIAQARSGVVGRLFGSLELEDQVVSINGQKIDNYTDIQRVTDSLTRLEDLECRIIRGDSEIIKTVKPIIVFKPGVNLLKDGTRIRGRFKSGGGNYTDSDGTVHEVGDDEYALKKDDGTVAVVKQDSIVGGYLLQEFELLGMEPRIKVDGVPRSELFSDSPADIVGIEYGDVIVEFAERTSPSFRDLQHICREFAGKTTSITVLRKTKDGESEILKKDITILAKSDGGRIGIFRGADYSHPIASRIRENSPAANAGIEPGSRITRVNDRPISNWQDLYNHLLDSKDKPVKLTAVKDGNENTYDLGILTTELFDAEDYQIVIFPEDRFMPLMVETRETNPLMAMSWGLSETYRLIVTSYASIRSLAAGDVSLDEARGPVGIGEAAIMAARKGFIQLVYLMAIISSAVAVFNFLPLPVLDGGHAVLLIIEKVRGRPLPLKVVNAIQMTGLVLILSLAILLTFQDCSRLFAG